MIVSGVNGPDTQHINPATSTRVVYSDLQQQQQQQQVQSWNNTQRLLSNIALNTQAGRRLFQI